MPPTRTSGLAKISSWASSGNRAATYGVPPWITAMYPADPHAAEISLSASIWVRSGVW
ncbi:hypothetical protein ABZX40_40330 [Streptomyces sp. NPDC004610]|uniref:hypothetical protein n=1 Tax=unclassified Streptomyces TaxID=2593676 RepID=UPI0033AB9C36